MGEEGQSQEGEGDCEAFGISGRINNWRLKTLWLEWKGPFVLAVKFLHVLQGWDERKDVWQKMRLLGIDESECSG